MVLPPRPIWSVARRVTTVVMVVAETACGGDVDPSPAGFVLLSGDGQNAVAGAVLSNPLVVEVVDASGAGVPGVGVAWTVTAGGGSIAAVTDTTDALGVASASWTLGAVAGSNTATANVTGPQAIPPVTFSATAVAGPPASLAFTVQPGAAVAGMAISPAVQVTVLDALGNTVTTSTASITVAIGTNPGSGALSGAAVVSAVGGTATFSGLSIDRVGTGYTLTAAASGVPDATSSAFAVSVGAAVKLAFTVQPSAVLAGSAIAPAVQVRVQDAPGNTVNSATTSITVAITSGTGTSGAVLGGTLTRAAVGGVATFDDLSIDRVGTGYTLTAAATGLTSATSSAAAAASPMTVSGVTPTSGLIAGGTTVAITGSHLVNVTAVSIGGAAASGVSVISDTQITAVSPAGATAGAQDVVVVSSIYGSATCPGCFTFNPWGTSVATGSLHSCGLASGGAAYCWGSNGMGRLGNGTTTDSPRPVPVSGGHAFQVISAGATHNCGLTTGGAAWCWGANGGALGNGSTGNSSSPVAVSGGLVFQAISAGMSHTCALTTGGPAYCWGINNSGELGDSTTNTRTSPVAVMGGLVFQAINAGTAHTCGLTTGGAVHCWGLNNFGQLGDGTRVNRSSPVAVAWGLSFQAISAGNLFTCGIAGGGAGYCWGENNFGQLGDGTTDNHWSSPTTVSGGHVFQAISAGSYRACGIAAGGAAWCWGQNDDGQLGDGTLFDRHSPAAVAGGLVFQSISAGVGPVGFTTCGFTSGGAAYCWGFNNYGQLGNGSLAYRSTPTAVLDP